MEVLPRNIIRTWMLPLLTFSTHGRASAVEPTEFMEVILYKLKTICQWHFLLVNQFFTGASLTWQGVYARFNTWRKNGSWQRMWLELLWRNKAHLDCSSVQLDGTHTPAKNGGAAIGTWPANGPAPPQPCSCPTTRVSHWLAPRRRQATTTTATTWTNCLLRCAPCSKRSSFPQRLVLNSDSAFDT